MEDLKAEKVGVIG